MKKILPGIIVFVLICCICAHGTKAAQASDDPQIRDPHTLEQRLEQYEKDVKGSPNLSKTTHEIIISTQLNTISAIVGEKEGGVTGAIPALTTLVASMYDSKPASTQAFLADISQSARIVPQAEAQGLGYSSLNPIMFVWKTFRNIAYFIFVLVFLVTGFMIMFRHKINGQVVVTVEQAIPNIIVALIFVTFSYAIGGLLIDIMYLVMYLIIGIFEQGRELLNKNILELGFDLIKTGFIEGTQTMSKTIQTIIVSMGAGNLFGFMASITVGVIVALALLFGVFKLFLELLKSYISIILSIAFSPIILMVGAIPGQNTFKPWIRSLIGNLIAFPLVLILLIIQKVVQHSTDIGMGGGGFMPPFLLSQGVGGALPAIVGIGILLTIPEIVKKVKEKMGASDGVFGEFAGAAWNRLKSGEIAIPIASAGIQAPMGAGSAVVRSAFAGTSDPRTLWRHALRGYEEQGDDGEVRVRGGFAPSALRGWQWGQAVRRTIDRATEGRLLDPEDFTKTLTEMAKRQRQTEERDSTPSRPIDEP